MTKNQMTFHRMEYHVALKIIPTQICLLNIFPFVKLIVNLKLTALLNLMDPCRFAYERLPFLF